MINAHMIEVGAVTLQDKIADPYHQAEEIIKVMKTHSGCGVLVFPELCLTGYTCADLFFQSSLLEGALHGLQSIVEASTDLKGLLSIVSMPVQYQNALYNCAVGIQEGKILGVIPKVYIPNYSEFYEQRWFTSGENILNETIELCQQKIPFSRNILFTDKQSTACIGCETCEDVWVLQKPSSSHCLHGANIICNPSASDELIGKQDYRRNLISMQSGTGYCGYIYASSGTYESSTDLVFSGHCMIAESGKILKESIYPSGTNVITALLDLDHMAHDRIHTTTYINEQDDYIYVPCHIQSVVKKDDTVSSFAETLKRKQYSIRRLPFVPEGQQETYERTKTILQIQANGLATRVKNTGIKNLVIGISGGLDSTLALIVCAEAKKIVPDIHILSYTMPNRGNTTSLTLNNAWKLMELLSDEKYEVPIESYVQDHLKAIGHSGEYQGSADTTYENAQARMRTYILMDVANMKNGLVVGTGDLSELALGWCTYNGDHMSMYAVNTSIPKTLVKYMVKAYGDEAGGELKEVLYSICDTPISPELTPNKEGQIAQKTEEKIGKYDLNDFFLFYTLRYGTDVQKLFAFALKAYPEVSFEDMKASLLRFYKRFFTQQFKRSCLPDGPKVGSVTLSPRGDWRMPSDASVKLWLTQIEIAQ